MSNPLRHTARSALSAAEVVVGAAIMAALVIPTWSLFVSGRQMVFKSKFAYLAMVAAREEIEDLRMRAAVIKDPRTLAHDWLQGKLEGPVLGRLMNVKEFDPAPDLLRKYQYSSDQSRIFTKVEVFDPKSETSWPAVLHVRWQEHGEDVATGPQSDKEGLSRLDFVLVKLKGGGGR